MDGYAFENLQGVIREGIFQNHKLHGYGFKKCDKYSYEGQFQQDLRHGYGVCREDGVEFGGFWQNDELVIKITNSFIIDFLINKLKETRLELGLGELFESRMVK